jgi:hypothetical protein
MSEVKINTADGEQWARMYAMALKREQVILAERDRLREALEWARDMIIERTTINDQKFYRPTMEKIRAALAQGGQDEK